MQSSSMVVVSKVDRLIALPLSPALARQWVERACSCHTSLVSLRLPVTIGSALMYCTVHSVSVVVYDTVEYFSHSFGRPRRGKTCVRLWQRAQFLPLLSCCYTLTSIVSVELLAALGIKKVGMGPSERRGECR